MSTYTAELVWERGAQDFTGNTYSRRRLRRFAMTRVTLRPRIMSCGERQPMAEQLEQLHHKAHEECYIVNSVKTEVRVEPASLREPAGFPGPSGLSYTASEPRPTVTTQRLRDPELHTSARQPIGRFQCFAMQSFSLSSP